MPAARKRILIVEDDADTRDSLSDILASAGYDTAATASGEAALANHTLDRDGFGGFDLLLLDYKMPGITGLETFRQIRVRNPDLPAIMITAWAGDEGIQQAARAGKLLLLSKPVDVSRLIALIDDLISGARAK